MNPNQAEVACTAAYVANQNHVTAVEFRLE